jgi:hypothetical protein
MTPPSSSFSRPFSPTPGVLQLGCTLPLWGVGSALAHVAVVDIQARTTQKTTKKRFNSLA